MRTLFKAISRFLLLSLLAVQVNGQTFDLAKDYGIAWNTYVPDLSAKYTITTAKAKFPAFYAWWSAAGKSDASFLSLSEFVCAHNDAVWRAHAAWYTATCQSRAYVIDPHGRYAIDFPLMVAFGEYHGQGTSAFYAGGTIPQGGTELYVDHSGWMGDAKTKNIFQSNTWGREDLYSYNESFVIDGYRLVGMKTGETYDANVESSGIAIWDAGSTSRIGRIFVENFNTAGIHLVRGTPATVDLVTSFRNNLAGVYLEGGGMHHFGTMEFDENPAMFYVRGGHGRSGATCLQVDYVKAETGIAPGRSTAKYQMVMDAEGWINAHFSSISYASVGAIPHAMFRVKGDVNSSNVKVDNVQLFGPCFAWMQDVKNGKLWPITAPGGLNLNGYWGTPQHGFSWSSDGTFTADFGGVVTPIPCASNRLDGVNVDPMTGAPVTQWNHAAGTPDYPWDNAGSTPPPPTPCTGWTVGAWSTCTNGTQTRTVTPSPAGCTGTPTVVKPAESQACTVTTPTTKWASSWASPLTLTPTYCVQVNVPGVTTVELKDFTPSTLNYLRIIGWGTGSLQLWPDGSFRVNGTVCTTSPTTKPVANQKWSGTITLPSAQTVTAIWQVSCGAGGAQLGTVGTMNLK